MQANPLLGGPRFYQCRHLAPCSVDRVSSKIWRNGRHTSWNLPVILSVVKLGGTAIISLVHPVPGWLKMNPNKIMLLTFRMTSFYTIPQRLRILRPRAKWIALPLGKGISCAACARNRLGICCVLGPQRSAYVLLSWKYEARPTRRGFDGD